MLRDVVGLLLAGILIGTGAYLLYRLGHFDPPPAGDKPAKPEPGFVPGPNMQGVQEIRFKDWDEYNAYIDDYCRRHGTEGLNVRFDGMLPGGVLNARTSVDLLPTHQR